MRNVLKFLLYFIPLIIFSRGVYSEWQYETKVFIASRNWVKTPCKLLHVSVKESNRYRKGVNAYNLDIQYLYSYDGKSYKGDRNYFVERRLSLDNAEKEAMQLAANQNLACYVNLANPCDAVLNPSIIWHKLILHGGVGFVVSLLFLYAIYGMIKEKIRGN